MENQLSQARAPIFEALRAFSKERVVPFDVPGHKHGKGNPELTEFLGQATMDADVNSMKPLDNLCHPVSVIHDAEVLAAQAFGAAHAFFMVSGTTGSVQAMILSVCKRGDKIIMPRNVHRSAINALVLCGAVPVYVNPGVDPQLGIALGMSLADVERAIEANPDDLTPHGMRVLADEAHGTHFSFSDALPVSAMAAGADMAAVSMHKSGGSLTQSSMLLIGPAMSEGYVRAVINLTQTTSASYLLLASLDISRRNLALRGQETMARVAALAEYARAEINAIGDYDAFSKERINGTSFFDFDITKLSVHTLGLGLAGIEVYDLLRDGYGIQIEFGDIGNILAYVSVGDREREIERLVSAMADLRRRFKRTGTAGMLTQEYIPPQVVLSPQDAFYGRKVRLPLEQCEGRVCGEFVMCYPPGIPILAPGERITRDVLDYITYAKAKGCNLTGPEDLHTEYLNVLTKE